jgi:hypothetical protein
VVSKTSVRAYCEGVTGLSTCRKIEVPAADAVVSEIRVS